MCQVDSNVLEKKKSSNKIISSCFSPDGLYLVHGSFQGNLTIRDNTLNVIKDFDHKKQVLDR